MPILDKDSVDILYLSRKQFCDIDEKLDCQHSLKFQGGNIDWSEDYQTALDTALLDALYEPGATRLTLVFGQFWSNAEVVMKSIAGRGAGDRNRTKTAFYGQAMVWNSCNIHKWCDFPELGSNNKELSEKFSSDVKSVLEVGDTMCGSDRFHCFFATHPYGVNLSRRAKVLIDALSELTSQYAWAHFIDYNEFTPVDEVIDSHVTPAIALPAQQMIWNTVCEAPSSGCPDERVVEMSPSCWADSSPCDDDDWRCMVS